LISNIIYRFMGSDLRRDDMQSHHRNRCLSDMAMPTQADTSAVVTNSANGVLLYVLTIKRPQAKAKQECFA
jgi:hypothetical protein